jgi:hypothetical protein
VQSVVAKKKIPTRVTRVLISNSRGIVQKAPIILVKQPAKQDLCLVSPTSQCGCQAEGFGIRTTKQNK